MTNFVLFFLMTVVVIAFSTMIMFAIVVISALLLYKFIDFIWDIII